MNHVHVVVVPKHITLARRLGSLAEARLGVRVRHSI